MDDDAIFFLNVENFSFTQLPLIGGLASSLRVEGRSVQNDPDTIFTEFPHFENRSGKGLHQRIFPVQFSGLGT